MTGFLRFKRKEEIAVASKIKRRFTDTEMQIVRETDLLELLTHLGYQVKRIGRYHTTAEMDSLRIKDRRTWFRYSQNTGGDAITLVQQFCDKTFPEAVEYLLTFNGRARDSPAKAVPSVKRDEVQKPFIWAATRQAPTSTFPRRWASPPSTPRPTGRPKGGPGLTPPTSR